MSVDLKLSSITGGVENEAQYSARKGIFKEAI